MARKPGDDERQKDFFGAPAAPAPRPGATPARTRKPRAAPPPDTAPPEDEDFEDHGIDARIARLSPAELRALVAALPDAVLAELTLLTIRQLRRRLARAGHRGSHRGGTGPASVLERAARQLVSELGEAGGDEFDA